MNELKQVNPLAVLVGVVILSFLGFVWYGMLFIEPWADMQGLTEAQRNTDPSIGTWISNIIATIIPLYVLGWLLIKMGVKGMVNAALVGLLLAFTFSFLPQMIGNMFAFKPYGLAWVTGGSDMVAMAIGGAILGAWPKKG